MTSVTSGNVLAPRSNAVDCAQDRSRTSLESKAKGDASLCTALADRLPWRRDH